jgi:HPt (histidine-containing phosphotransfer) domain-containing protein
LNGLSAVTETGDGVIDMEKKTGQTRLNDKRMKDLEDSLAEDLGELVATYLEDTPRQIAFMRESVLRLDREAVHRLAHLIKSSSAIFGADRLVEMCRQVELAAKNGQDAPIECVSEIQSEYELVQKELSVYL